MLYYLIKKNLIRKKSNIIIHYSHLIYPRFKFHIHTILKRKYEDNVLSWKFYFGISLRYIKFL